MCPLFQKGIEVKGQRRGKGFAFTRLHFSYFAFVQDNPADKLNIEMAHPQRPYGGFPDGGKGLREEIIQRLASGKSLLEFKRFCPKLIIRKGLKFGLQMVDHLNHRRHTFQLAVIPTAKNTF